MPSLWIDALKQFNHEKGAWCIPRKGSEDYDKVRALMGGKAVKDAKTVKKAETPKKAESPAKKAETPKKAESPKKADKVMRKIKLPPREEHSYGGAPWKKVMNRLYNYINKNPTGITSYSYAGDKKHINPFQVLDAIKTFDEPYKQFFKDFLEAKRNIQAVYLPGKTFIIKEKNGKIELTYNLNL